MGFWSSVSSFCSSVVSSASSAVSSAASAVGRVASAAWEEAKSIAGKAIDWMADKAENFVGSVQKVWQAVKPFVEKIAPWIDKAADLIPWPWLKVAVKGLAKGVEYLMRLEKSPLLKKVEQAIQWAVDAARYLRETFLTTEEEREAEQRKKDLQEAIEAMATEEQRQSFRFAQVINDYILIQTRIQRILEENSIQDFEHYLRLRATQKLLRSAEEKLQTAKTLEQISSDDAFLLQIGADLLAVAPTLSDEDAQRLDKIIKRRYSGKSLLPFVFEELIHSWQTKLENMEATWDKLNRDIAQLSVEARKLETAMRIEPLSPNETEHLSNLRNDINSFRHQLNYQENENRAMQNYVFAAEGFLQTLEKEKEDWEAEGREWVIDEVAEIGLLLIDCAQNNKPWDELTEEQQSLIIDYANIFAEDSKKRTAQLNQTEVA